MTSELESAMATRPNSSDQRLRFLDLPFEIRTMIYTELFVVRKELFAVKKKKILGNFDDDDDEGTSQTLRRSERADVGCVVITALVPTKYDSLFMKRSSFIVEGLIKSYQCPQATTYSNKSGIDLCLLATNRQIYQETSEILYSRNMFYFDELSVVTPFLKDRGNRSKSLMRNLSIPYTSSQAQLEGPVELHNYLLHHESILEDVFCYLSLHMQNLVQLDLRVHRGYFFHEGLLSSEDGKMLQSPGDFPAKQRKQLATLGQGVTLTVSQSRWDDWRNDNKIRDANLFAPLRPWLRESILQIRAKDLLQHERLVCENAVEGF